MWCLNQVQACYDDAVAAVTQDGDVSRAERMVRIKAELVRRIRPNARPAG